MVLLRRLFGIDEFRADIRKTDAAYRVKADPLLLKALIRMRILVRRVVSGVSISCERQTFIIVHLNTTHQQ
jgi:hypothetical protein